MMTMIMRDDVFKLSFKFREFQTLKVAGEPCNEHAKIRASSE